MAEPTASIKRFFKRAVTENLGLKLIALLITLGLFIGVRLQEKVESDIEALEGNAIDDRTLEVAGLAATVATGQELLEMLHGKREFPEAVTEVVKKTGTAGAATAITAYLFS